MGNPTILATMTVVAAILPMAFVGGLMGPYMRPIPVGASAAMVFSLLVAFVVTPWAAVRLLRRRRLPTSRRRRHGDEHERARRARRASTAASWPALLDRAGWRWLFLGGVVVLLLGGGGHSWRRAGYA